MSVLDDWRAAPPLAPDAEEAVRRLAREPIATAHIVLPTPPGINAWWEPFTMRVRGRPVASMRLTKDAIAYKRLAERTLLERGIDPVELEERFADLWLRIDVVSYLSTPLERDADGPVKPIQDLFCSILGVDDARVRHSVGRVLLDPTEPRAEIRVSGFRVWDSSGEDGPYYLVRTRITANGPRTEPQIVTPRRAREVVHSSS